MAISLTPPAADRVRNFLHTRGKGVGLRLGVKKTGCSGFAYVVSYADEVRAGDVVFDEDGVKVIVDAEALRAFWKGAIVFETSNGFVVLNTFVDIRDRLRGK